MQLLEEYLKRHKLNVPVIRHVQSGYAFFRFFDGRKINWHILNIEYDFDSKRPSQYVMQWMAPGQPQQKGQQTPLKRRRPMSQLDEDQQPVDPDPGYGLSGPGGSWSAPASIPSSRRRSYSDAGEMFHMEDRVVISWDEYEEFILETSKKRWGISSDVAIMDGKEIFVTAWEMFVFAYERSFAPHLHQDDFFDSLDENRSIQERNESFRRVLLFLKKNDSNLWANWVNLVEPMLRHYCFWLVDVLRKK